MSHLLIVCSNPDHAEIPAVVCHDAKLTCAFATPLDVEQRLAEELPDMVLIMVADPLPLAHRIHAASPRTPMVAITGAMGDREQRTLRAAGVSTIVFKPYSIQALRRALLGASQPSQETTPSWSRPAR